MPSQSKVIILKNPPKGELQADTFGVETRDLDHLKDNQVLVKALAIDNIPALRTWIQADTDERRLYAPPIRKGDVIKGVAIGEVLESKTDKYKKGDRVIGSFGWREYAVVDEKDIQRKAANIEGHSEWVSISGMGINALTACSGVFTEMKLKKENTLLVSGAAGSVGSLVIQLAKNVVGCEKVVGIAGGKEKCDFVKQLGADDCLDYKSESFEKDLAAAFPDYVDFFFDNVGGPVLDTALKYIKRYGYVAACGAISGYNGKVLELKNYEQVVFNRITIKGFILNDHVKDFPKFMSELEGWIKEGKLGVQKETVIDTKFEDLPKTWAKLFTGENTGKLISKIV